MLRWLALVTVISVAFSEEAAVLSKGPDGAETVEAAQEAAESKYPIYGRRSEERDRGYGYINHETQHELKGHYELQEPQEPRRHEINYQYDLHKPQSHELKGHFELKELRKLHDLHKPRHHELKGHYEHQDPHKPQKLHEHHETRHHEPKDHYEPLELHKAYELHDSHEPRHHESKGHEEIHELHKQHELHEPEEPRHHKQIKSHELHESHKSHHHESKGHHQLPKSHEPRLFEPASHHEHEHNGPRVAKLFDPHRVAHYTPHGVGIVKDALSPDYIQPTWFLDYRYVKTGNRDYAIADGGQVMILPDHVKNHEPKEYGTFAELLEFSRLKKLAKDNADLLHPEKGHEGYKRSREDSLEQNGGRKVHEHDRHSDHFRVHYER